MAGRLGGNPKHLTPSLATLYFFLDNTKKSLVFYKKNGLGPALLHIMEPHFEFEFSHLIIIFSQQWQQSTAHTR